MELTGKQGKTIIVEDNFVRIVKKTVMSGNYDKRIPIKQITSVEVVKPSFVAAGYIQIAEIGASKNKGFTRGAFQAALDENSVVFQKKELYEKALIIKEKIENLMINNELSQGNNFSIADEIQKLKTLLDQGVLSQEEFESKKKQLLNI